MSGHFLDGLMWWLHMAVIAFNLFGWISPKTKRVHLVTVLCTMFSWIGLGIYYGWGYCFLTDWHWQIKWALGEHNLPNSFITYLTNNQLGMNLSSALVDNITALTFAIAVVLSFYVNRDLFMKH